MRPQPQLGAARGSRSGGRAQPLRFGRRPRAGRGGRLSRHARVLGILGRVAWAFRHEWPWHLLLVASTLGGISAELVEPWLHQIFVNRVLLGRRLDLLPDILWLYAAAAMAQWLAHSGVHFAFVQATERFSVRLRVAAYAHLRRLGLRALRRVSTGEATAALQQFGPEVGEGFLALTQSLLASLYRLPASLALLSRLNGPLLRWTLPALALYPLYPLLTANPLRRALTSLSLFDVHAQGVVTDQVAGLRALLHRTDARPDVAALRSLLWRRVRLRVRAFLVDRAGGLLDILAHQGMTVLLLGVGGLSVLHGRMTVGALLAFLEYVRGVEGPVRRLLHLPVGAQRVAVVAERVFALLDEPLDVRPPRRGRPARLRGEVELRGVGVRGDDGAFILRGIDLRVPAGAFCAVVGESGAGKSTLGALIPRYLDPDEGQVLLDGVDAREYDLEGLRAAVALVPQDPVFFRESVLDNVRIARPGADDAQVRAALERAHAGELLAGGGTSGRTLQEGAGNLSGGQRQRVALARAYLQDPAIFVLDEATSALDPALQRRVLEDLLALRGRRTVIFITHQPEVAARADLVVVLREGRLVRAGPPARVLGPPVR
jgi:ATP-binding cassette subfamily B protein